VSLFGDFLAFTGRWFLRWVRATGIAAIDLTRILYRLPSLDRRELVRGFVHFGYDSLPLALGMATIAGGTVVAQTSLYVQKFGGRSLLGWAAGFAVLWEFGPLLLGLMMGARVGARNAAELASLNIGGQIEGLRGISLDPFAVLVAPRVVAIIASIGLLSTLAALVAMLWAAVAAFFSLGLPVREFFQSFAGALRPADILGSVIKSTAFGASIAVISTSLGLRAQGGARAVGRAAASAVVFSAASIFSLDFFLTQGLERVLR
jgi:phospholipid/cholesterol/gamma-HCH transport system permease protein